MGFAEGESCTTTIDKDEITDQDGAPDNMAADFVFTFTTDVAPSVVSTDPADGDSDVLPTESITINFSEIVNATTNSFTIECPAPGNLQSYSLSSSPASSFTLTPNSNLPAGTTCTVTVIAAQITDVDAGDPPDNLAADFTFSFTLPVVAHDDIYPETVTGNVSVNSANVGSGAFSVTGNDEASNPITITAFDATSASGGTVSMTTSGPGLGEFTYNPPAGYEGPDSFSYTISDGTTSDGATVSMTVTGMIWFIDNTAAPGGDGRLSSPHSSLADFEAANGAGGANDPEAGEHIFLYESSTAYNGPVTLLDNQRFIGQDATSSLPALTGITPAPSSAPLPAMNSGNATIAEITSSSDGVVLAQNNQLHGLTVGNTTGVGIGGASFGALTVRDVDINGSGQALNLTSGDVNAIFGELSSSSGAQGIRLDAVTSGTLSHTATSSISNHTGEAVRITGSSVGFTYDGDISNSGSGIVLSANSGSTIDFTGTLTLTTANNAAFVAVGGGTVTSTGMGSTIVTTTATAFTLSSTTIGGSGITFESISASGASKGILLAHAGTGGLFSVTGSGNVDGSGGTIQSIAHRGVEINLTDNISLSNLALTNASLNDGVTCTGVDNSGCNAAIYLNGVTGVSLNNVDITGAAQQGINGLNVANLTLDRSTIIGIGNAANEGGVRLFNLSGTVSLTNSGVESSAERNVYVRNTTGTLTMSVSGNNLSEAQSSPFGAAGLEIELSGSAQLDLDVDNNGFYRDRTVGLQIIVQGNAVANSVDVTNNTFNAGNGIGRAVDFAASANGQLTFNFIDNRAIWTHGGTAVNVRGFDNSTVWGRINGNRDIQTNRNGPSGGHGISVGSEDDADVVVSIDNNGVSNIYQDIGIQVFARNGAATVDATVTNNTVALQGGGAFPLYGVEVRAQNSATTCANVSGNSVTLGSGLAVFAEGTSDPGATVQLQGFNTDAATTWNGNSNTPAGPVIEFNAGTLTTGTCRTVTHPIP
jgi:hypothetical protein